MLDGKRAVFKDSELLANSVDLKLSKEKNAAKDNARIILFHPHRTLKSSFPFQWGTQMNVCHVYPSHPRYHALYPFYVHCSQHKQ